MTQTMRERLKARLQSEFYEPDRLNEPTEWRYTWGDVIDAILSELRTPDEGMAAVGFSCLPDDPQLGDESDAFTAMIDHVRGEKT